MTSEIKAKGEAPGIEDTGLSTEGKYGDCNPFSDNAIILYGDAFRTWGIDAQRLMFIEETSEAIKEICKFARDTTPGKKANLPGYRKDIGGELADLSIMIAQMVICHGCLNEYDRAVNWKLERLENRIIEHKSFRTLDEVINGGNNGGNGGKK